MLSEKQVVVVAAVIVLVAFISFTVGLFCRRNSDAELIGEQDAELDARQATINVMARQLRRVPLDAGPGDDTVVMHTVPAQLVERIAQAPARTAFVTMPDWAADQELQLWVECAGADLQRYVGALIAQAEVA